MTSHRTPSRDTPTYCPRNCIALCLQAATGRVYDNCADQPPTPLEVQEAADGATTP